MDTQPDAKTTVLIVGAGIAGLTLALSLQHKAIPFLVLEAHKEVAPQVGASVGLLPNGLLILDQLGVYEDVRKATTPCVHSFHRNDSGNVLLDSYGFKGFEPESGYPMVLLERQTLLQLMYDQIKDTTRIRTDCRVMSITETLSGVKVFTQQGQRFEGQVVVGADGIHSKIRNWIASDLQRRDVETNLNNYLSSKFSCVFGISDQIETLPPGEAHFTFNQGHNFTLFTGKDGIVYWFLFEDMGKSYEQGALPRFAASDAEASCQQYLESSITPTVKFGDVYSRRKVKTKVPFEEGVASHWHSGRVVIVGDSAHKMTTNSAMGGNMAIESAACLANCLIRAEKASPHPTTTKSTNNIDLACLSMALEEYHQIRLARCQRAKSMAGGLTRSQFMPTMWSRFAIRYLLPRTTPAELLNRLLKAGDGGVKLDFMPVPSRALRPPGPSAVSHQPMDTRLSRLSRYARPLMLAMVMTFALSFTAVRVRSCVLQ